MASSEGVKAVCTGSTCAGWMICLPGEAQPRPELRFAAQAVDVLEINGNDVDGLQVEGRAGRHHRLTRIQQLDRPPGVRVAPMLAAKSSPPKMIASSRRSAPARSFRG